MAEANGAGAIINALYQADAQMENQKRVEMHQKNMQTDRQKESDKFKQDNSEAAAQDAQAQNLPKEVDLPTLIYMLTSRFARLAQSDATEFKIRMLGMKQSMPSMYIEVFRNLQEMNLIAADLLPDLQISQKETPGQIPSNVQGDVTAADTPSRVEQAPLSGVSEVNKKENVVATPKALPEQKPPRADGTGSI